MAAPRWIEAELSEDKSRGPRAKGPWPSDVRSISPAVLIPTFCELWPR